MFDDPWLVHWMVIIKMVSIFLNQYYKDRYKHYYIWFPSIVVLLIMEPIKLSIKWLVMITMNLINSNHGTS